MLDPLNRILKAQSVYGRSPANWHDGELALGRNLYPILPEDGLDRQPVQRGGHGLVADLRLDNRTELAGLLGVTRNRLAELSDAALLFECLLKWRDDAADRLVGEFAFAWWDQAERRLLLGRDILGHRPLYFHRGNGFVAFASMPSGLHALADIPNGFDAEFVAESLALLPRFDRRTHFRGIERVQPAHLLSIEPGNLRSWRYWNPSRPAHKAADPRESEEELRRLVDLAVGAHLRGADKIASTHLSAGLDSTIVTSSAAVQFSPNRILAMTAVPAAEFSGAVPAGVIGDEGPLARTVAERYPNVEQLFVESSGGSPLEALDREHFYHQQPIFNIDNAVWSRAMNRLAHERGAKVMLTGTFGNLTATYTGLEYLGWLLRHGRVGKALALARSLARNGIPPRTILAQLFGPFLPHGAWAAVAKLRGWVLDLRGYTAVSPAEIRRVRNVARSCGYDLTFRPYSDPFRLRLDVFAEIDVGNYVKGTLAEWGVSLRDPLADRRVIDFCLATPVQEFVRDGVPRSLARRAFADRLPPAVRDNPIRGYQAADWYVALRRDEGSLREEVETIARCTAAAAAMDLEWIRQAANSLPDDGWARNDVVMRYRYGLLRAVSVGHFMRKVAGTN